MKKKPDKQSAMDRRGFLKAGGKMLPVLAGLGLAVAMSAPASCGLCVRRRLRQLLFQRLRQCLLKRLRQFLFQRLRQRLLERLRQYLHQFHHLIPA